jgi:serine/threonine protein kinase/tetratricopeptide (TPR) repeat protein
MDAEMDGARWSRVKAVFSALLEREPGQRAAYLAQECGDDTGLRREIESLLSAHENPDTLFSRPAAAYALDLDESAAPRDWIGRRVGVYRIVEAVGRGGMSEVFRAVRDDDEYHKDVAVKVLREGYDTRSLLKRFKVEKQILATLDHPNIARLLDAGSTEEGLPYLVMDYIPGRPIDEHCTHHRLDVEARLELFQTLCSAVQYVHRHLMVHGDLKCSNVLVTDDGVVKLLDFGIAKLVQPAPHLASADAKLTGLVALTPEYASPEQIRGGAITTASDVYSLGVVLYKLLSGSLPHRVQPDFAYRLASQIVEGDTRAPSVAALESSDTTISGSAKRLTGDLDNIVQMALQKEPAKRYSSVERFEEDIRRHLQGFPVQARPAAFHYRFLKFAGRHKAGIAIASLFVVTLVAGILATTWMAQVAWQQRARAERHFAEVRKLANTFMFDVHGAIADLPGSTPARQMLVENSLRYLEGLSAESGDDPTLRRELATAYEKVGDVQGGFRSSNLGDRAGAMTSYRKALALRDALATAYPKDLDVRRELLRTYGKLGEMLADEGRQDAAIENSRRAAKLASELVAAPNPTLADRRNLGNVYYSLGWQLSEAGKFGDGSLFLKQATVVYESLIAERPDDTLTRRALSLAYQRLGNMLLDSTQRFAEARQMHEKGLQIAETLAAADPQNTNYGKVLGYALLGVASAQLRLGNAREALVRQLAAAEIFGPMAAADPRNEEARIDAAHTLTHLGETLNVLGRWADAEQRFNECLALLSASASGAVPGENYASELMQRSRSGIEAARAGRSNGLVPAKHAE